MTEDGLTKIDVQMSGETVWLSLDQMADLFQRDKSTISRHIKNIFGEGELDRNSVVANFATTAADGKVYQVDYYNLDVIISVGYRVKSLRGTQFRIWANSVLKEYLLKGFAMNDELLKKAGGGNYFDELLERIRDIRSSEKVFWRKVLDIYAHGLRSPDGNLRFIFQDRSKQNALGRAWADRCRENLFQCGQYQTQYGTVLFQRKSSYTGRRFGGKELLQSGRTGSTQWNCFRLS